ncbi:MAG: S41 family peptidase, partial [Clostridiales bacterium]
TMQGRPAQKGGLLPGDILISVDDEDTASLSSMAVSEKVKGKIGSKVKLGIERKKQKMSFTLTREKIELETVRGMILENHPQIAYLAIGEFSENTAQEFINIYNDLQKKHGFKGLIIDLRDNGGGSLGASVDLASYFVPKNEVVVWQKKKDGLFNSKSEDGRLALPVVCLQNESSASASEVFLGAMKDYDLAETIGKKTFGKGITQSIYQVRSGGALRYTESHYFTPNKYDLHGKGIPPDIEIDNPAKFIYDVYKPDPVQDKQLKKAIDVLQEKLQ